MGPTRLYGLFINRVVAKITTPYKIRGRYVGWADDVKRRVAVGNLVGPALQWQDLTGNGLAAWADWLAALQTTFQPCLRVVQLPTEPGAQYALEKMKICRLCPHQLPDAEVVNYLSKGLYYQDQRAILLANPPANLSGPKISPSEFATISEGDGR